MSRYYVTPRMLRQKAGACSFGISDLTCVFGIDDDTRVFLTKDNLRRLHEKGELARITWLAARMAYPNHRQKHPELSPAEQAARTELYREAVGAAYASKTNINRVYNAMVALADRYDAWRRTKGRVRHA